MGGCEDSPQQWILHTPERHDASDNAAHFKPGMSNVVVVVVVALVVVLVMVVVVDEMLVVVAVVVVAATALAAPSAHRADWLPSCEGPENVAPGDTEAGPPHEPLPPHTATEPSSFTAANAD